MKRKKSPLKDKIRKTIRDAKSDLAVDVNSKSSFNILESIIKAYGEKTRKTNLIKLNENALKSYIRHFENKSIYFYFTRKL